MSRENVEKANIKLTQTKQENNMKIEKVVLIDGQRADDISEANLVSAIELELAHVERLDKIIEKGAKSKAIEKLRQKHFDNVEKLSEILDKR